MRPPPPLTLQCPPSRGWRGACAAIGAAAGAAIAAWGAAHLEVSSLEMAAAALLAAALGSAVGARIAGPMRPVQLRWDGEAWSVDGQRGELQVMLDLERWLLLRQRHSGAGATRWVALSRAEGAGDLHALRTALYSRPPEATTPHVRPPDRAAD